MTFFRTLFLFAPALIACSIAHAQFKRVDSTVKIGKVGYRVQCNNKSDDKNQLSVKPIGFDNAAHELGFYIKGKVKNIGIEDLNNDNFPDLLVYIYNGENNNFGTVYAFMSQENKSMMPVPLPDVMLDGKLKEGYKGHDEFSLLEGTLMQEFPIYKEGDAKDTPTGGKRVIQYHVIPNENGGLKFKVLRSYETK